MATPASTSRGLDIPQVSLLRVPKSRPSARAGHLQLGGCDPAGNTLSATSYYLQLNGRPLLPAMGEFHYSRVPRRSWDGELGKVKAGGIDIVATYVFWIHHEEDEGTFVWTGDRDLRAFVELCGQHNLMVLVRIGPFCHGECRNGGLPDWLYGRGIPVRSTDSGFLSYVRRLYGEISARLAGLLFKDGGPVVGVQLDNEYMHAGAPWETTSHQGSEWVTRGDDGVAYMRALKHLAQRAGLDVPLYTCTAWHGSPVPEGELLPMHGGYAFHVWVQDPNYLQPPTREFLFRDRHAEPLLDGSPTYSPADYPYACCELGGGTQPTHSHRPIVPPECVEAMALVALGSGANVLGYYMYHGGSNPMGRHGYLNEHTVSRVSYDFQAPLGEFGRPAASYQSLRLIHLFLHAFGSLLAPMRVALPEGAASIEPSDAETVRWAARLQGNAGFIFLTNYQDHAERHDQQNVRLALDFAEERLVLPRAGGFTLPKGASAILPINLSLEGIRLIYATAQPLTYLHASDAHTFVFFALAPGTTGLVPGPAEAPGHAEFAFDRSTYQSLAVSGGCAVEEGMRCYVTVEPGSASVITLESRAHGLVRILTLSRDQALNCSKLELWGEERLLLSQATVLPAGNRLQLHSIGQRIASVAMIPAMPDGLQTIAGTAEEAPDGLFTQYTMRTAAVSIPLGISMDQSGWWTVRCRAALLTSVKEVYLRIDYTGDAGEAYLDGVLIADNLANGTTWEIGLGRFAEQLAQHDLVIHVTPLCHGGAAQHYLPSNMAMRVETSGNAVASIDAISAVPEYEFFAWPTRQNP